MRGTNQKSSPVTVRVRVKTINTKPTEPMGSNCSQAQSIFQVRYCQDGLSFIDTKLKFEAWESSQVCFGASVACGFLGDVV